MKKTIEDIEIKVLLDAVQAAYGYDFRHYATSSLRRRLELARSTLEADNYSQLQEKLLHNKDDFNTFLKGMSITVTEMFRDPMFYKAFASDVVPALSTYSYIKVWHAGCATGEEVYSIAILLHEAGLLERTTFYATDFNNEVLAYADEGIYPLEAIEKYNKNYIESGGASKFSDYYIQKYKSVKMKSFLRDKITFANHNLVTDNVFGEMNVVLCRNVMIYFNPTLQNRVLHLFRESLCHLGYLCLGSRESLSSTEVYDDFEDVSSAQKIYRKKRNGL